jgi:hypothetical protein
MIAESVAANTNREPHIFEFFTDPAHGWVKVPWTVFHDLAINPDIFTAWSYADNEGAYLEEDEDFPKFERIFLHKTKKRIVFYDTIEMYSEVRAKTPIKEFLKAKLESYVPPWKQVILDVCKRHKVTYQDVLGESRTHKVVRARQEVYYRLKNDRGMSYSAIGKRLGKDHSTVMYGVWKHGELLKKEKE